MQVQIPPAVLTNMQSFATTAPTAYTDQVNQDAATLADDSKASDDDKLQAWVALTGLLSSATIYKAGNVADLQTALDATQTTAFAKSLTSVADQYQYKSIPLARAREAQSGDSNGAQDQLDVLNSFSAGDQKKLFVMLGFNQTYADMDAVKADYQNQSNAFVAQHASARPTDKVTLSDSAKALFGQTDPQALAAASGNPAEQALAALKAGAPAGDKGAVALTMLQAAARRRVKDQADGHDDDATTGAAPVDAHPAKTTTTSAYAAGDHVDQTA